ncbi:MAG: FTR1 family protein [Gammaproteobacteria bacterium]|nr:FTR1 family protein [Gammaproteobacteria bacterium]
MLQSVIIFLREILEAALLISVLLGANYLCEIRRRWVLISVVAGLVGALLVAFNLAALTDALDGTGQEIFNASSLFAIAMLAASFCIVFAALVKVNGSNTHPVLRTLSIILVAISIAHEGAELAVFCYAFSFSGDPVAPMILGAMFGIGIGASAGTLIYYLLLALPRPRIVMSVLLVLIAAGATAQAIGYLAQAGLTPAQFPLWDSSWLLQEESLPGQLLYALIGYEASPTGLQVAGYLAMLVGVPLLIALGAGRHGKSATT